MSVINKFYKSIVTSDEDGYLTTEKVPYVTYRYLKRYKNEDGEDDEKYAYKVIPEAKYKYLYAPQGERISEARYELEPLSISNRYAQIHNSNRNRRDQEEAQKALADEFKRHIFKVKTDDIFRPGDIEIIHIRINKLFKGQLINKLITVDPYPLTQSTAGKISKFCYDQLQSEILIASAINNGGYGIYMKANFSDENTKFHASAVFRENASYDLIFQKIIKLSDKNYDTASYTIDFTSLHIIISSFPNQGGCNPKSQNKIEKIKINKGTSIRLLNLKSKNNNCLIQCFVFGSCLKGNKYKPDSIKKELGFNKNDMIKINDVHLVSDYFKKGFYLYNTKLEVINSKLYDDENDFINLYLRDDHYFIMNFIRKVNCKSCGHEINPDTSNHKCSITSVSYKQRVLNHKNDIVKVKKCFDEEEMDYSNVIHFDLETFTEDKVMNKHVPYACGWFHKQYEYSYGKNCLDEFVDLIINVENKIISAYNGSGFDFYFLFDKLTERNIHCTNIIISNGKVMSFNFGKGNKIFDLFLFTTSSLDKACKDFEILNAKSSFDHRLINTWGDVDNYKNQVLPYLKLDVHGLKELFEVINKMIFNVSHVNIHKFITISHMSYELWSSKLKHIVEIPKDMEKYNFIKSGTYGARCYPQQKVFKSDKYNDIISNKLSYDQLLNSLNFIFNADATSLYSASMKGFELVQVSYPTGYSRWSYNPIEEWKNNKIGFYEINFFPPKDILVPILPTKNKLGLSWSLENGTGVYPSVDIQSALDVGYEIHFINKCLVWDEQGDIFGEYVTDFFQLKIQAEKEVNKVKRSIAKLMLNALYGKTLQKAIFTKNSLVYNGNQFNEFFRDKSGDNFDWVIFNDNKMLVTGELQDQDKVNAINKPCHLGAFVLAYSRKIMLHYMKVLDPTLKRMLFTYTDTDSLHLLGSDYLKLKSLGYIKPKHESKLGYLCSDIDHDGLIINEINLAPKCYCYEYINSKGEINVDENAITKCKGIPQIQLKSDYYYEDEGHELHFTSLKKIHKNISRKYADLGITPFNIVSEDLTRTFNKNPWSSNTFYDNRWFPQGYITI